MVCRLSSAPLEGGSYILHQGSHWRLGLLLKGSGQKLCIRKIQYERCVFCPDKIKNCLSKKIGVAWFLINSNVDLRVGLTDHQSWMTILTELQELGESEVLLQILDLWAPPEIPTPALLFTTKQFLRWDSREHYRVLQRVRITTRLVKVGSCQISYVKDQHEALKD